MLVMSESWHCSRTTSSMKLRVSWLALQLPLMITPRQPSGLDHLPLLYSGHWSLPSEAPSVVATGAHNQSQRYLSPPPSSSPKPYACPRQSCCLLLVDSEAACCWALGRKRPFARKVFQGTFLSAFRHTSHKP